MATGLSSLDCVCAYLQNINIASTDLESAQAAEAKKKRDIAIAVPTVIGGVVIIGVQLLAHHHMLLTKKSLSAVNPVIAWLQ